MNHTHSNIQNTPTTNLLQMQSGFAKMDVQDGYVPDVVLYLLTAESILFARNAEQKCTSENSKNNNLLCIPGSERPAIGAGCQMPAYSGTPRRKGSDLAIC